MRRKSRDSPMILGERYVRGSKDTQRWRGSSGDVRLSHLYWWVLFCFYRAMLLHILFHCLSLYLPTVAHITI